MQLAINSEARERHLQKFYTDWVTYVDRIKIKLSSAMKWREGKLDAIRQRYDYTGSIHSKSPNGEIFHPNYGHFKNLINISKT